MNKDNLFDNIYREIENLNYEIFEIWKDNIVFSWRWWLGIGLSVIPWVLWFKYRDKKDTARLLFVGLVVMLITNYMDVVGMCYGLWHYNWKILPYLVIYIPWDFCLFPVLVMFLLQLKKKIKPLIKALFFAVLCAFVFEPFFSWIDLYEETKWKAYYSFFVYIALYLLFNRLYNSKFLNVYNKD